MRLPITALLVVGSGVVTWCGAAAAALVQPAVPARPSPPSELYVHTIAPRDTLIALSRALLTNPRGWRVLQRLNHVANPRRLRPGSTLAIPIDLLKSVPATGDVLWVRGSPRVARPDGTNVVALVGSAVGQGARITTGAGEAIGLRLSTGATITVGEHADIGFIELRQLPAANAARTGIDLRRGRIQNEVTPSPLPNQRYEIRTPVVTAAVRGTTFRVGVDDAGATALAEVVEGRVGVARGADGLDVPAGFGAVTRQGAPLTPPRALLTATVVAATGIQQRLPIRLRWSAIPGAVRYRAEVRQAAAAAPGAADALIDERVIDGPEAQWTDLADGAYRVTIRGIDADGLEGTNAEARLEVDARPEPPIAQGPVVDAVVIGDRAAFAWTRPAGVATFDLEVTPVPGSDATPAGMVGGMLVDPKAESALPPGRYTWRVRSRRTLADGSPDVGPWGDALGFTVKARPPAGPPAKADTADKATLALRWAAGERGDRYRVQLERVQTHGVPLVETVVAEPTLSTPRPAAGLYAVRVAIVNADGIEGPFGPEQTFEVPKLRTRSWWWIAEPIAAIAAFLVAM